MNSILDRNAAAMNPSADTLLAEAHLTDDQIDDQLIGDLAAEPAAHLASCSFCSDRVTAAAAPIASFDSVTLAWSERRSATLPLPDVSAHTPIWQRQSAWIAACFALAVGIAFSNVGHQMISGSAAVPSASRYNTPAPAETATADPVPTQIESDNQMLKAVADELATPTEAPAELGLQPVDVRPASYRAAVSLQD